MSFLSKSFGLLIAFFGLGSDLVTVSVGTVGNAGNAQADQGVYLTAKLLEVAEFNTILDFPKVVQEKSLLNTLETPNTRGNQRQAASEVELATMAGFFAGEGCIQVSGGKWPTLYAGFGNSEKFWVTKFLEVFGGSTTQYLPKKFKNPKIVFYWRVSGKDAYSFLKAIQPFLIGEKAEQLKLGLQFQEFKWSNRLGKGGPTRRVDSVLSELEGFQTRMKLLRRAAAETNRRDASPERCDSPTLEVIPVS